MIAIENLTLEAGNRYVLKTGITLLLEDHKLLVVSGSNGAGKSTFLRQLVKLSTNPRISSNCREIAYLPQLSNRCFVIPLSVGEIIDFDGFDDRLKFAAEHLELEKLRSKLWNQLSGGERQKVLLVKTLQQRADLLVLDEPFNHVDSQAALRVSQIIFNDLAARHYLNVVLVSHIDPSESLTNSNLVKRFAF